MLYPDQRYAIATNRLLDGNPPRISLAEVRERRNRKDAAGRNLSQADTATLAAINAEYGETGLARLAGLAERSDPEDFLWFFQMICDDLNVLHSSRGKPPLGVLYDNEQFPESPVLARFNHMIVQPGLSNLLYSPGCQHGFLTYGVGGARILVSHPFKGATTEVYDQYRNSLDVMTSLLLRGMTGTFLFLDNLAGLNRQVQGVEAWALWFSIIATHSDLVLVVIEGDGEPNPSQKLELSLTPDRIHKKVVRLRKGELTWAKGLDVTNTEMIYGGPDGQLWTREEQDRHEARLAEPFLEQYADPRVPRDALIIGDPHTGQMDRYPLNYTEYELPGR